MAATKVANAIYNALKNFDADEAWFTARHAVEDMCSIEFNSIKERLTLKWFIDGHVRKMFKNCRLDCACTRVDSLFFKIDHITFYSEINEKSELKYDFGIDLDEPIIVSDESFIFMPKSVDLITISVYDDDLYDVVY
jgi:hypothetical protein